MSTVHLKVKIKALAAEAGIIRHEERKFPRGQRNNATFASLNGHRRYVVRPAARSALLAYGFLRKRSYRQIERECYEAPSASHVADLVCRFGGIPKADALEQVKIWFDG